MRYLATAFILLYSVGQTTAQDGESMSFFITSVGSGNGADLGGIVGADLHCQNLATTAGTGDRIWRAYLSTQAIDGQSAINARDRIGQGPWYNARGQLIANNLDELHGENNITQQTARTETDASVGGGQHDILTGSQLDGTTYPPDEDHTCGNWTSNDTGSAQLGHHNRSGGGDNPTSWNSAHASRGCSQQNLISTAGNGYFYCFASDDSNAETAVIESYSANQPDASSLQQNYPNPFNSETTIQFQLDRDGEVELAIYNLAGQRVETMINGFRQAGQYAVRWHSGSLPTGAYIYQLRFGEQTITRKLLLLR